MLLTSGEYHSYILFFTLLALPVIAGSHFSARPLNGALLPLLQLCNTSTTLLHVMTTTTVVLRPFVRVYPGEPVPEETFTNPPSWSSSNLYHLLPSTTIHSILSVQIVCSAIFLHNLSPRPFWSASWSGALHLIFHTFLHPITVFFSQHMPIHTCM